MAPDTENEIKHVGEIVNTLSTRQCLIKDCNCGFLSDSEKK